MSRAVPDWLRERREQELATGGAIVSLRQRGYDWGELAAAFDLADVREARRLAAFFLAVEATRRPPQKPPERFGADPPA